MSWWLRIMRLALGLVPGLALTGSLAAGCVSINLRAAQQPLQETRLSGEGREKLLLIEVAGFISGEPRGGRLLGDREPSLVSQIAEIVRKAETDRRIKGVILRINTPGGTVTGSDTIYHELAAYKQRAGIPMIAQILDLGTSGGYYIAQAADRIVAQPTTVTGSIGVIMVRPTVAGLLAKLGVDATEITSGRYKAMGSPFSPLGDDERALFQAAIDELHTRFVRTVAAGRPRLTPGRIAELADGRIYTAQQARDAGLIDEIGYLDESIARLKETAGLTRATVVTYTRPGEFKGSVYAAPVVDIDLGLSGLDAPGFLYLWQP